MLIPLIPTHEVLPDMPSATNADHDARYLNLANESVNVTNGTFDLTTTGSLFAPRLSSTGDLFLGAGGGDILLLTTSVFRESVGGSIDLGSVGKPFKNLRLFGDALINTLTIATGSITDSTGNISFGDENLSTTGTFGAGNTNVGTLDAGATNLDTLIVNPDNADVEHIIIGGFGLGGDEKGGNITWQKAGNSIAGYTYVNSNNKFVFDSARQSGRFDSGNASIDFDDGTAVFGNTTVGTLGAGNTTIDGTLTVDHTDAAALLIQKNGAGGVVMQVDTSAETVVINNALGIGTSPSCALDVVGDADISSQLAVGSAGSIAAGRIIHASEEETIATDTFALNFAHVLNPAATKTGISVGTFANVSTKSGNVQDFSGKMVAYQGIVVAAGTGTVSDIRGFEADIALLDGGGTLTNFYNFHSKQPTFTFTADTGYGFFHEGHHANVTTKWAFYANADPSWFGGDVSVNGVTELGDGGTTNFSRFEADGTLEFNGTATVFKDINIGAGTLSGPPGLQPGIANFIDENGADTGIATFGLAVGEGLSGFLEIQHGYKEGSDVTFHIHWQGVAAPAGGTDNVQFQLTYTLCDEGAAETLDAVTVITTETAITTQYSCLRTDFTAITGTNFEIGDQFLFTIERIAASADEYAGEALLQTIGIHYEIDTVGSRQILTK